MRKHLAGFDLIQISIVIAVLGVLMAGAYAGVPAVMARLRATQETQDLLAYVQAQDLMPFSTTGDVTRKVCEYQLYPESACMDAGSIRNRFGGRVTVTRRTSGGATFIDVESSAVPSSICARLISALALTFDAIAVQSAHGGRERVKTLGSTTLPSPTQVNRICSSSNNVTLIYTLHAL